jgi:HlyD family secretion protein
MDGMDKKIEKKKGITRKHIFIGILIILVSLVIYKIIFGDKSSKLNIDLDKITIEEVKSDIFQDYIAVQGTVQPIQTIFLDAVEGGRVESIQKEEGSMLKKGDVILQLSNNNLILEISNNEAQVSRSVSELRNARILMEQQLLNSKIQIFELSKQVKQKKRAYEKNILLQQDQHISIEEFEQSKEDFETSVHVLELYKENFSNDSLYRGTQVSTLEESVKRMTNNLKLIMSRLDNLNVKSPVNGELANLNPEIGQVINYGTRVGTINILDSYKLRVEIDEYYISRIVRGLMGSCEFAGIEYPARITKLYPEVQNGRFAVDMVFTQNIPPQIRIGQTSRIKMELGESQTALLLSKGGFYQSTGGQWVYVVDNEGEIAVKRTITIGRHNPKYYEILDGLQKGDKVIVSSYDNFGNVDKLILRNKR